MRARDGPLQRMDLKCRPLPQQRWLYLTVIRITIRILWLFYSQFQFEELFPSTSTTRPIFHVVALESCFCPLNERILVIVIPYITYPSYLNYITMAPSLQCPLKLRFKLLITILPLVKTLLIHTLTNLIIIQSKGSCLV